MKQLRAFVCLLSCVCVFVPLSSCANGKSDPLSTAYLTTKLLPLPTDSPPTANRKIRLLLGKTTSEDALRKWVDAGIRNDDFAQISGALASIAQLQTGSESVRKSGYNTETEQAYRILFGTVHGSLQRVYRLPASSRPLEGKALRSVKALFPEREWVISYQNDLITALSSAIPRKQQALSPGSNNNVAVGVIWFERNIRAMEWGTTGRIVR